jgi:hypothetical protein
MCGDGELQEGPIWEAVMFAGQRHLDNLCLLVDRNNGQLDISSRMIFPMPRLEDVFASFNWKVHSADATSYEGVYAALEAFRFGPRNGQPTAIISHSTKGYGALSDFMNKHKVVVAENLSDQEETLQQELRARRVEDLRAYCERLDENAEGAEILGALRACARDMNLDVFDWSQVIGPVVTRRAPPRDKRIRWNPDLLPKIDPRKEYSAADIVTSPYLTSSTRWYLTAELGGMRPFIVQERQPVKFVPLVSPTDANVFNLNVLRYGADMRLNAGYSLPQLAVACDI